MNMDLFLKHKIERQLQINGRDFVFKKYEIDQYNQVSDEVKEEIEIRGIFHTTNSYIKGNESEGARLVSKPQPMILMLYEDGVNLEKDDQTEINGNLYKIIDKNDVNNFGVAFDVSMELIT